MKIVAVAAAVALNACVPIAWVLPPLRIEVADAARVGVRPVPPPRSPSEVNDLRASAGLHLANVLKPDTTHADLGLGYVLTEVGLGERTIQGVYVEGGPILARSDGGSTRLSLGARGEALFPDRYSYGMGYSILGRLSGEVFGYQSPWSVEIPPNWSTGRGLFVGGGPGGTYGFSWFVEGGEQVLPGGEHAVVIGGGVSVRIVPNAAFGCCVWLPPKLWLPR